MPPKIDTFTPNEVNQVSVSNQNEISIVFRFVFLWSAFLVFLVLIGFFHQTGNATSKLGEFFFCLVLAVPTVFSLLHNRSLKVKIGLFFLYTGISIFIEWRQWSFGWAGFYIPFWVLAGFICLLGFHYFFMLLSHSKLVTTNLERILKVLIAFFLLIVTFVSYSLFLIERSHTKLVDSYNSNNLLYMSGQCDQVVILPRINRPDLSPDDCYYEKARNTVDLADCEKITDNTVKNKCKLNVYIIKKDFSNCENLGGGESQKECSRLQGSSTQK